MADISSSSLCTLSISLPVSLYMCVKMAVSLSVAWMSVCQICNLSVILSVCLSVYFSVCLSVYLFVCQKSWTSFKAYVVPIYATKLQIVLFTQVIPLPFSNSFSTSPSPSLYRPFYLPLLLCLRLCVSLSHSLRRPLRFTHQFTCLWGTYFQFLPSLLPLPLLQLRQLTSNTQKSTCLESAGACHPTLLCSSDTPSGAIQLPVPDN